MSAATILFTDIVGFSRKPTSQQRRVVDELNRELLFEIRLLLNPPMGTPRALALPTGDGAALVFLHDGSNPLELEMLLRLILRVQRWAAHSDSVRLRIGVQVGAVSFITDVNGRTNVCGETINYTQRVMDAANPSQVLFSEAAFREYVTDPDRRFEMATFPDAVAKFDGPVDVFAKHSLRIPVYKLSLWERPEGRLQSLPWWNNDDPCAKDWTMVTLAPLPKEVAGSFGERLVKSSRVALIQLTGNRLLASLTETHLRFSEKLDRLWIFMPDPEFYQRLPHSEAHPSTELVVEWTARWKEQLLHLRTMYSGADIRLGLVKEPPFLGASYLNWDRPGGRIHVSAYVWGVPPPKCPGFELEWLTKNPSPTYETYVKGLDYLHATTRNALDD